MAEQLRPRRERTLQTLPLPHHRDVPYHPGPVRRGPGPIKLRRASDGAARGIQPFRFCINIRTRKQMPELEQRRVARTRLCSLRHGYGNPFFAFAHAARKPTHMRGGRCPVRIRRAWRDKTAKTKQSQSLLGHFLPNGSALLTFPQGSYIIKIRSQMHQNIMHYSCDCYADR